MCFLSNLIFTFTVSIVIAVATYLLQYCSNISPCNIEFDERKSCEIRLMIQYNRLFDKIFTTAILVIMMGTVTSMLLDANGFMIFLVILELIYFIFNFIVMSVMYIRSKIYWYKLNLFENEKIKKKKIKNKSAAHKSDFNI